MKIHNDLKGPAQSCLLLLGLVTLLAAGQAQAAWYAKFDGVDGSVTEGRFAGWTLVQSAGALVGRPVDPTNGAPDEIALSCELLKTFDSLSPALLQSCDTGSAFSRVTLAHVAPESRGTDYRITLENVRVSSLSQTGFGPSESRAQEKVVLSFDKFEAASFELDENGGNIGGLTARFDQTTGLGELRPRLPFRAVVERNNGRPGVVMTWHAESGHRYQIQACVGLGQPWTPVAVFSATEDGIHSEFLAMNSPTLFMRVEEID